MVPNGWLAEGLMSCEERSNKRMQQTKPRVEDAPAALGIIYAGFAADPCCSADSDGPTLAWRAVG